MNYKKWLLISLIFLLFVYLFFFQVVAIWPFTIDDMYISLRYARHWVDGQGIVWNVGEAPVEGYSNFIFVVLAALALKLGCDPVFFLKAAGAVGLFFTTIAIYFLSRFWFSSWISLIPCFWFLLNAEQMIWSISGLETTLFQALLYFALVCLLRGIGYNLNPISRSEPQLHFITLAASLFVLASMTRPEVPILVVLFGVLALYDSPVTGRKSYYQILLSGALCFAILYLPYLIWRWLYFGSLLPNSVQCKGFIWNPFALDINYLKRAWPYLLLGFWAGLKKYDKRYLFLYLPSLVYLLLLIGSDIVSAFSNRLFLPAFGLLLPLTLQGIKILIQHFYKNKDEIYNEMLLFCSFLFAFFFIPSLSLINYHYFSINPQAGEHLRKQVAHWLSMHAHPGDRVVLADSGLIPYYNSLKYIDSYCLNNKSMTRVPKKNMYKRLCEEIFIEKPEVLILTIYTKNKEITYSPTDVCLQAKLKKNNFYQYRTTFRIGNSKNSYQYEIYTLSK